MTGILLRLALAHPGCSGERDPPPPECPDPPCTALPALAVYEGARPPSYFGTTLTHGPFDGRDVAVLGAPGYEQVAVHYALVVDAATLDHPVELTNDEEDRFATALAVEPERGLLAIGSVFGARHGSEMGLVQVFDAAQGPARARVVHSDCEYQNVGAQVAFLDTTGAGVELVVVAGRPVLHKPCDCRDRVFAFPADLTGPHAPCDADRKISGPVGFGAALAGWDTDLDGLDELVVGAEDTTYHFAAPWVGDLDVSDSDAAMTAPHTYNLYSRVRVLGDVDGDGAADLALGTLLRDEGELVRAGAVYVAPGGAVPSGDIDTLPIRVTGDHAFSYLGTAIAGGDVDGDGRDDLVVGAPGGYPTYGVGSVLVFTGPLAHAPVSAADATAVLDGDEPGDWFGHAIDLYDANGDGHSDLLVGAPARGGGAGRVYLLDGARVF